MNIWIVTIIGFLVGVAGTGLGSLVGIFIKKTDRILGFLLGLTGGFMMFIVSFHLFPEAFYLGGIYIVLLGVVLGIGIIVFLENLLDKLTNIINIRTGVLLSLSIALHNFPEGLALGSTLVGVTDFGLVLSLAMLLHNIPEGISLALPFSISKVNPWKILSFSLLAGAPTGLGAYVGAYLGNISNMVISFCLALAGGIMLYIVCDDLIPTGKTLHKGRVSSIAVVMGYVLGIILYF
ncbi:MAG: ZIP family metal transporter [Tissierellia bacterium]|nr:ZIP family metal transporter [Tissierellia bacterium]